MDRRLSVEASGALAEQRQRAVDRGLNLIHVTQASIAVGPLKKELSHTKESYKMLTA